MNTKTLKELADELESLVDDSGQFKEFKRPDAAISVLTIAERLRRELAVSREYERRTSMQHRECDRALQELSNLSEFKDRA